LSSFYIWTVSVTIFQVFSCHNVGSHDQEDSYMAADHRVSCDSERYLFAFWWAIAMVFVYPVGKYNSLFFINVGWTYTMYVCIFYMTNVYTGIPLLYFCILRVSRVRNKNSGIPIEVINMLCEDFTDQYWYESWRTECDVLLFVIDECDTYSCLMYQGFGQWLMLFIELLWRWVCTAIKFIELAHHCPFRACNHCMCIWCDSRVYWYFSNPLQTRLWLAWC
jgi:hypothetical protein